MSSIAPFFHGMSHAYICPSTPVSPHEGHMTCHWWCPKEWLKGVVASTLSGYCLFHLFIFPCFHDLLFMTCLLSLSLCSPFTSLCTCSDFPDPFIGSLLFVPQMHLPVLYKYWPLPTCMFPSLVIISLCWSSLPSKEKDLFLSQGRTSALISPRLSSL